MRTSDFGFRSMSFAAAIVSACFVFSSCSKENIGPSTSAQVTEDAAARKPVSIIRKKIVVLDPDVKPGIRKDNGAVKLSDYKIDINNNYNSGRESAADQIKTDGMGGLGTRIRDNSTIEFQKHPAGLTFHPRVVNPREEKGSDMQVVKKEIIKIES